MKIKKQASLLCIDFEYIDFIYNPIASRYPWIELSLVSRPDRGLEILKSKYFDAIITTVIAPGSIDGITLVENVRSHPEIYGEPIIAVLTGLGGEKIIKKIESLDAIYIPRFSGFSSMTDDDLDQLNHDIDKFLSKLPQSPKCY